MKNITLILILVSILLIGYLFRRRIKRFFNLLMSKYDHFTLAEFDSPDSPGSGAKHMNKTFVRRLDKARDLTKSYKLPDYPDGVPFIVLSAARTESHNKKVGGVKNSAHLIDENTRNQVGAADLDYNNEAEKKAILKALVAVGFNRFGIRTGASGSSIHVDDNEDKPQFAVWGYNGVSPGIDPFSTISFA